MLGFPHERLDCGFPARGLPAGLFTLWALRLFSKSPLWLSTLLAFVPVAFWTAVAALIGCLLPAGAIEPFLWFAAAD